MCLSVFTPGVNEKKILISPLYKSMTRVFQFAIYKHEEEVKKAHGKPISVLTLLLDF